MQAEQGFMEAIAKVEEGLNELVSKASTMYDSRYIVREPPVDIFEDGDYIIILVDLPGFRKDSIKVRVGPTYVEVQAEPSAMHYGKAVRVERYGNFRVYRKVELGVRLKIDSARAVFKDGVLQITIPKLGGSMEAEVNIEG